MTTGAIKNYIANHRQRFIAELLELLRIPSVSSDPTQVKAMGQAAEQVASRLRDAGATGVAIDPTGGHPVVYGELLSGERLPTVLVYGHYDVQPADPLPLWTTPPFTPTISAGKIFARGASDDKGQLYMHIKALELMKNLGPLPCNLKFLFEGEEEIGSLHLGEYIKANRQRLQADLLLISDTTILGMAHPSITVSLRGLSYLEVEVMGPNRDLHSGVYGGAVGNPLNILCRMVSSLFDEENRIAIPGFYDQVVKLSAAERAALAQTPFDLKEYCRDLALRETYGEAGYTPLEQSTIRPTLDLNGIWGGYSGEGSKTVLPARAQAKISLRLVPNQDPATISQLVADHLRAIAPAAVTVTVTPNHGGEPVATPTDSLAYRAASQAMATTFGRPPIPSRCGASIPIVSLLQSELGINSLLLGFGLDSDAIHSPNEHFAIDNFLIGIETIAHFYYRYAALVAAGK